MEYRQGNLAQELRRVREQVEAPPRDGGDGALWERLCLIIAEVLCLRADCAINIGGEPMSAALVQDVFRMLGHAEVDYVIGQIGDTRGIRFWKSWARSALYNAVFEEEIDVSAFAQRIARGER